MTYGSLQSSIFTIVNLSNCEAVYLVTAVLVLDYFGFLRRIAWKSKVGETAFDIINKKNRILERTSACNSMFCILLNFSKFRTF